MKEIKLTQGKVALVDGSDFDWLSQWKWNAMKLGRLRESWYAARREGDRTIYMHCQILGKLGVDHRDSNGLNNQRENLREAKQPKNCLSLRKRLSKTSSTFKGVSWEEGRQRWRAELTFKGKRVYLGRFQDEEAAARAYDQAAVEHFGEFALLNFPEERALCA